jgi:chromosome segregation ATPase
MSEYIHKDDAYEWLQDKQIQFVEDDFAKVQAERDALIKNKDDMEQQMYAKDHEIEDLEEQAKRMELRFQYLLSEIARLEGEHARGL